MELFKGQRIQTAVKTRMTLLFVAMAFSPMASAQVAVRVHDTSDEAPRIDGRLRQWGSVQTTVQLSNVRDAGLAYRLLSDDEYLYLEAEVSDERVVVGRGRQTDAVVLTFITGNQRQEIWFVPGAPGTSARVDRGGARGALRPVRRTNIVEERTSNGFTLEARVPKSQLPRGWSDALLVVAYNDVDSESRPEIERASTSPQGVPMRFEGGPHATFYSFLEDRDLPPNTSRQDITTDVDGQPGAEFIARVARYVVVYGPQYRGGNGYDYITLPVREGADVSSMRPFDMDGDGDQEIVLEMTLRNGAETQSVFQVLNFDGTSVSRVFTLLTGQETPNGRIENQVDVRPRRGRAATIRVRAGRAQGLGAENFEPDDERLLLPWGPIAERQYRFDGSSYAVVEERENPRYRPPEDEPATNQRSTQQVRTPAPQVNAAAMMEAARGRANITQRPDQVLEVNVAEGRHPELIHRYGNNIIVVGERFRSGNTFYSFGIDSQQGRVVELRAMDVTRDGRRELLFIVEQQLDDVTRHMLLVHRFMRDGSFPRVLIAEIKRAQGPNFVENGVERRQGRLVITPGQTRGWAGDAWPWQEPTSRGPGDGFPINRSGQDVIYRLQNAQLQPL